MSNPSCVVQQLTASASTISSTMKMFIRSYYDGMVCMRACSCVNMYNIVCFMHFVDGVTVHNGCREGVVASLMLPLVLRFCGRMLQLLVIVR